MHYQLVVVILTYNEEIHIERAIKNVLNFSDKIIIVDSYSQDKTVEISKNFGAEILFRKFDNYKNQRQYAINHCKSITQWMLFLDADEYLLPETKCEILDVINKHNGIVGYYINRRFIFMNRWIKHGGYYPSYLLRLFQPETAILHAEINEHVVVKGSVWKLKNDFVDHNLKNIEYWIDKHNKYTTLEAINLWACKTKKINTEKLNFSIHTDRKKWIRQNIWNHLPLLWRAFFYFIYRYFFRFGFLDGKEGFIYHFLQAGWLWFVVDVKWLEIKKGELDGK